MAGSVGTGGPRIHQQDVATRKRDQVAERAAPIVMTSGPEANGQRGDGRHQLDHELVDLANRQAECPQRPE